MDREAATEIGATASCDATIRYNPSRSWNLEFGQNKWINR